MTAHITVAQARAAGITVPTKKKKRTTRKEASGPYHTICKACGVEFHTIAGEDKHLDENPNHCRYDLALGL